MDGITPFPVVKIRNKWMEWWKLTQDEEGMAGGWHHSPPHSVQNQVLEVLLVFLDSSGCCTLKSEPRRGSVVQITGCLKEHYYSNSAARGNIAVASLPSCDTHTHTHICI